MEIVETIRKYVEDECKKPSSKYGYEPYLFHFVPMVKYAEKLADELGGDKEVILIAAWLHDIGSIIEGRENHHIAGAKIAEAKLRELNYPDDKIKQVKKCILHHRGSRKDDRFSIEEKIIAEADALSNFENIPGIFKAAYYEGLDQREAMKAVKKKLENKYKQLGLSNSKNLIKPKYDAAMLLFSDDYGLVK
jgi:uncharacterized protein